MRRCQQCGRKLGAKTEICPHCATPVAVRSSPASLSPSGGHDRPLFTFYTGCLPVTFPPSGLIGGVLALCSRNPEVKATAMILIGMGIFGLMLWAYCGVIVYGIVRASQP